MADNEYLKTRVEAIGAELAALDQTQPGGLPNAGGADEIDHVGYKDGLYRELAQIAAIVGKGTVAGWLGAEETGYTIVALADT